MKKSLTGELFAEFLGTFILLFIGIGVVAALVLNGNDIGQWELAVVWGMAVTMAIYVTGAVSGTHINPAVTIMLAVWKGFDKKKVIPYIIAQMAGAFAAAASAYGLYSGLFAAKGGASDASLAGIFTTFPHAEISMFTAFMVEFAITTLLVLVILATGDDRNSAKPTPGLAAVMIGLVIAIIGTSFGPLTGFSMNPARDLGPRLFAMIAGWGSDAIGPNGYGFIVPIFGPILGALFGGFVYEKLIVVNFPGVQVQTKGKKADM